MTDALQTWKHQWRGKEWVVVRTCTPAELVRFNRELFVWLKDQSAPRPEPLKSDCFGLVSVAENKIIMVQPLGIFAKSIEDPIGSGERIGSDSEAVDLIRDLNEVCKA